MASYSGKGGPANGSVYVCNLPFGTDENMLAEHFGTIGLLKKDKRTGHPKVWIYYDKVTNEPKGDATVTYEDPHAALAAIEWFNKKDFHGATMGVFLAELKSKDDLGNNADDQVIGDDLNGLEEGTKDVDSGAGRCRGRGRGRGDALGKAWQQEGDWSCPNTSCGNINFAFRGVCNRCGTARPTGASSGGAGGGGRGKGRGGQDLGGHTRAVGATGGGLFGPNDWPCPMCGNINWAKRTKCNICNTNKPGHNEGGVRGGRGGGYKELDEEEIEETKRRRREAEEGDEEMYDEFGNLKKKFRAKTHQAEMAPGVPGVGRAGWEVEELGVFIPMESHMSRSTSPTFPKWRKVAYGGMQPGFDDNHTDESFLEDMIMNANVVKRDLVKVMLDSVSISQYLCIVALVVLVWIYTLRSIFSEGSLLLLDIVLLGAGFFVILLTAEMISFNLLLNYILKISFFITGLYILSPIYHTLTRSISSDSIWALTASLVILHLFLHNYSGSPVKALGDLEYSTFTSNISLNASIVASLLIASRLPSRLHVFAIVLFSLQVFLFAPFVSYCIKKYSFRLHLCFSLALMAITLFLVYRLHQLLFIFLLSIFVFVNLVCPYWLIRIQEYKFEINGPWDEAKLCFNVTE